MDGDGAFGISHLSEMPITLSFGLLLIGVLLLLVALRFLFADVRVGVR